MKPDAHSRYDASAERHKNSLSPANVLTNISRDEIRECGFRNSWDSNISEAMMRHGEI